MNTVLAMVVFLSPHGITTISMPVSNLSNCRAFQQEVVEMNRWLGDPHYFCRRVDAKVKK